MPTACRPIPRRCRTMLASGNFIFEDSSIVHRRPDLAINILASGRSTSCSSLARRLGSSSSLLLSVST
ncbi:unnamed protein product [Rotaria sp. Silwood2]|nr:unnamed protein product [Rotaria sp. Silwood2]CAF2869428.1 unnamed protein product [Rotaria sp. Silwood2]CAF3322187.1 unnamed protein product [Rotaria sp. Silwood2]CAF4132538.1 unnamed protein product [Rotaria sp. Silwood2]CAF4241250.1 unnamed protein product [Rotaria sp. Silwood2]